MAAKASRRSTRRDRTSPPEAVVPASLTRLGFKIRAVDPLPEGFDPLRATDRQLRVYRLPRRPDAKKEPELRSLWDRTVSRTKLLITPEFEHHENITHGPARGAGGRAVSARLARREVSNATSSNWSGAASFSPAGKPYGFVGGQWTVPSPNSTADGAYYASEWVGIDGWNSNDVLQAGTETQITKVLFFRSTQVYAWWEWFPAGEVRISNLPASAGDVMYCLICADTASHATVYFSNQSQGVGTSFEITAPSGTALTGNVAEWIVERPTVNGSVANLTDYAACYFDECIAGGAGNVDNLSGASLITMTGTGGANLSEPAQENDRVVKLNWRKSS
jgi:peptidase A4-like protein